MGVPVEKNVLETILRPEHLQNPFLKVGRMRHQMHDIVGKSAQNGVPLRLKFVIEEYVFAIVAVQYAADDAAVARIGDHTVHRRALIEAAIYLTGEFDNPKDLPTGVALAAQAVGYGLATAALGVALVNS